jgi:hypothetical protein
MAATDARCRDCGGGFQFDAGFYASKRIAPPKRCQACRADRRSRRETVRGVVYRVGPRFGLARDDAHVVFHAPDLRDDSLFRPGDRIVWEADPAQRPAPGRNATAYSVRRA